MRVFFICTPPSEGPPVAVSSAKVQSVDDFVPEDRLDKSFLEDSLGSKTKVPQPAPTTTGDSDRWDVNVACWLQLTYIYT